jgi:hypothetical protein
MSSLVFESRSAGICTEEFSENLRHMARILVAFRSNLRRLGPTGHRSHGDRSRLFLRKPSNPPRHEHLEDLAGSSNRFGRSLTLPRRLLIVLVVVVVLVVDFWFGLLPLARTGSGGASPYRLS